MPGTNKLYLDNLYAIADGQNGYFTAQQAKEAGYSGRMQIYHANNGDWEKIRRGIFRFKLYPPDEQPDFMPWYLWSHNSNGEPQGVFSHDTALAIYSIGTWRSKKIHVTVPPNFRRRVVPPILELHRAKLSASEIRKEHFVPVTAPLKTIADLMAAGLSIDFIQEALSDALDRQLIHIQDIKRANLTKENKKQFEVMLKQINNERKKIFKPIRFSKSA